MQLNSCTFSFTFTSCWEVVKSGESLAVTFWPQPNGLLDERKIHFYLSYNILTSPKGDLKRHLFCNQGTYESKTNHLVISLYKWVDIFLYHHFTICLPFLEGPLSMWNFLFRVSWPITHITLEICLTLRALHFTLCL